MKFTLLSLLATIAILKGTVDAGQSSKKPLVTQRSRSPDSLSSSSPRSSLSRSSGSPGRRSPEFSRSLSGKNSERSLGKRPAGLSPSSSAKDSQIIGVIVLFRHASRPAFRQHGTALGLPPVAKWINEAKTLHLLEQSEYEMNVLGGALKAKYPGLISRTSLKAVSSKTPRTIQSVEKVVAALGISKEIEVHSNDKADMPFSKMTPPECAKYQVLFNELTKDKKRAEKIKEYIETHGNLKMDSKTELFHVVGHLISLTAANTDYSKVKWATDLVNKHYDLIEGYMSEVWCNHVKGDTLTRLFVGPMLNAISNYADDITKEQLKMSLISSHDSTLTGVLKALRADPVVAPGFGGSISFEIRRSKTGFSVTVLYAKNFTFSETPVQIGPTLSLEQFNDNLQNLKISLSDWKEECKM